MIRSRHRKVFLGRKVMEEGSFGHRRRCAQVIDGGDMQPLSADHLDRRVAQRRPGLAVLGAPDSSLSFPPSSGHVGYAA